MSYPALPTCSSCPNRKGPLLGCCQLDELGMIADNKTSQVYQKGQAIFSAGSTTLGMHCVRQGRIKVTRVGGDGKEQIVRLAKGGDVLGCRSLLTESRYSTSAVALDDCVVCFVPRTDFLRLVHSNVQFSVSLMQMMAQGMSDAEERMLHLAYKPVRERLAEALLLLLRTYHDADADAATPFTISLSREDLAALVGTAKETATRLLSEFKAEGIIDTRGSRITLLAPSRLAQISSLYD
ncbi:Crp/Fnr family transcriptional regulator [Hymenobacter nivis]|uniref:Crp/Fnr family transcriptional regulator n=1 Tax=Hymenobacter nivis TaxID=1850093 RepID=A0A502GWR9_9BACT|nr:Crp/Fnr family transcriptional regulator [Hymenobacter nivis]TPG65433.1 Crp/Fnr family transcriptional regulator [Hymenobacter nivis]